MRRAKVDRNHAELVKALRQCGWLVAPTHMVGRGFPDCVAARGNDVRLIEFKAKGGRFTAPQKEFQALGWPVTVISTVDDVVSLNLGARDGKQRT